MKSSYPRGRIPLPRQQRIKELTAALRSEVFRYFPSEPAPLDPAWLPETTQQERVVQKVSFTSLEGLRVKASIRALLTPRPMPNSRFC